MMTSKLLAPKKKKAGRDVDEGWTLVTHQKKCKQNFAYKESRSYREYRRKCKSQRIKTRKNARKFQPITKERLLALDQ